MSGLYLSLAFQIHGQHNNDISDDIFGSDPLLFNGRIYTFSPPLNTGGNQFLHDTNFEEGSVTIRGVRYNDLLLNYDVYNQQLILKYNTREDAVNFIVLSDAWLECFTFGGLQFENITLSDSIKQFFQVIGSGPYRILYSWAKKLSLDNFIGAKNHVFSEPHKQMFLLSHNRISKFWNNKSYSFLFHERRPDVMKFLRGEKINVKKAPDKLMLQVINYCNSIPSN
ncbi:MAG: hypothetical protein GYA41_00895 [Bacteroidales bacterium]|nr:hypothetical protein [Bacteroidales bacterium]